MRGVLHHTSVMLTLILNLILQIENRVVVKKTFTRAVIQSKSLTKGKMDLLMLFMLDNHQEIFKVSLVYVPLMNSESDDDDQ